MKKPFDPLLAVVCVRGIYITLFTAILFRCKYIQVQMHGYINVKSFENVVHYQAYITYSIFD